MSSFLDVLHLSEEVARLNASFFESYAKTCLKELNESEQWTVPDGLPEEELSTSHPRWSLYADAASALRAAAQWTALIEPARAASMLGHAGVEFLHLHNMFGVYLLRVGGFQPPDRLPAHERGDMLLGALGMTTLSVGTPPSLAYPQQQTYLLLELASWNDAEINSLVREICERSAHRDGPTPVGALGAPIRHFWIMAEALAAEEPQLFLDHFSAAFRDRYHVAARWARLNTYLWDRGATGIDVVDPDALGSAALAARRFGVAEILTAAARHGDFSADSDLGVLFRLGLELVAATSMPEA